MTESDPASRELLAGIGARGEFTGYMDHGVSTSAGERENLLPRRRMTDFNALGNTRENYWRPASPENIRKASEDFKAIRRQTKERHQHERRVEVLSALSSRGDVTPTNAQRPVQFIHFRSGLNGQRQSVNPWNNMFMLKALLCLMTSGLIEGYDLGIITFANLYFQDRFFLSLGSAGAAFGALISGPIVDRFGRRLIVICADIMYIVGGIIMSFFDLEHWVIYMGRVFIGIAIGVTSMNVPIYISEIVPNEVRGRFVARYTLLVVAGQLASNVVCLILKDHFIIIFWIGQTIVIAQMVSIFFVIPESPRWLAKNGQVEEAEKVLEQIYKPEYVQIYKRSLAREISWIRSANMLPLLAQYKVLLLKYKRLIFIGCGLMVCQQVSGIVIAVQYGPTLIENAGFNTSDLTDEIAAVILSLPLSFVRLLGTVIGITVIDAKGRRAVLMFTLPILALSMIINGAAFACYMQSE